MKKIEAPIYNLEGKKVGSTTLPSTLFGRRWSADLVHQVVVAMSANQRRGTAYAKDRGAVSGGGRKPWKQKGTGRARHGSTRSPLWRKGGAVHGPTLERSYKQKINKKMRRAALASVLSRKWRDGEVLLVDDLNSVAGKTKAARQALLRLAALDGFRELGYRHGRRALVVAPVLPAAVSRGFRNLPTVAMSAVSNLDPLTAMQSRYLVLADPVNSLKILADRLG